MGPDELPRIRGRAKQREAEKRRLGKVKAFAAFLPTVRIHLRRAVAPRRAEVDDRQRHVDFAVDDLQRLVDVLPDKGCAQDRVAVQHALPGLSECVDGQVATQRRHRLFDVDFLAGRQPARGTTCLPAWATAGRCLRCCGLS